MKSAGIKAFPPAIRAKATGRAFGKEWNRKYSSIAKIDLDENGLPKNDGSPRLRYVKKLRFLIFATLGTLWLLVIP